MSGSYRQQTKRPSRKEATKKVCDALEAFRQGNKQAPLVKHLPMTQNFLKVGSMSEMWDGIYELLVELYSLDPANYYAGRYPPTKSYEPAFSNDELWAYCWPSKLTKQKTYIKFVMKKGYFFFFDCHEDNKK